MTVFIEPVLWEESSRVNRSINTRKSPGPYSSTQRHIVPRCFTTEAIKGWMGYHGDVQHLVHCLFVEMKEVNKTDVWHKALASLEMFSEMNVDAFT